MPTLDTNESAVPKTTCLSSKEHGCDIKDHLLHYLGCIEFCQQEDFFNEKSEIWKNEVKHQQEVLGHTYDEAQSLTKQKREFWEADCKNELKRIGFLRKKLSQDDKDKHLVIMLEESLATWRNSSEYKKNIEKFKKQREDQGKKIVSTPTVEIRTEDYDLGKDITVPIIQFDDGRPDNIQNDDVWNKFPNQKIMLGNLLNNENNLLRHDESSSSRLIRYFHIPSNNMDWVEQAIGHYFDEQRPDYHATHRELERKKKTKAYMILRDQYWRGQMHGSQPHSPAHARHMKPMCTTISSDPENIKYFHRNMVLFMPYLHWDTSRKNEQFSVEIEDSIAEEKLKRDESSNTPETKPTPTPTQTQTQTQKQTQTQTQKKLQRSRIKVATMSRLLKLMRERNKIKSLHEVDDNGRFLIKNRLGQFLLDAARLYEGMSNYRDKKLLREYISKDPPLHPRRTLDQAYHWTLNSTWERDRDQVVYRHTTTEPDKFHKYDPGTKTWQEHEDFHIKGTCEECKRNIQKLSRVIMVDQLWMWVLDAKTIITCFPKRYGSNKQDSSAVHKSIRVRIQEIGHDQIRTAFDLGLIIIDECINTLFNRARTTSRQPQVIDAFSKAIGNIMHKQTVAFERLWRWADNASDIYKSNGNGDASELHVTLLDIHPEGQLEREIKDIVEELDIMIHITKVHEKMLLAFTSSAENLLDPFGKFGENKKREMISNTSRGKTNKIAQSLAEYKEEGESLAKHEKEGEVPADEKSEKSAFEKRRDDYNWFKLNADELLETIKGRIDELEELRKIAGRTADSVKDLLELKQQQASVVQAWQAVRQSNETIKQSQSIMMFTLVTIIFLPLSFMSSVFGMNNMEITSETWSIHREFLYMFTISAAVIILSLLLAFGGWIRASLFYVWKRFITTLIVDSGIYTRWRDTIWPSKKFHHEANVFANRVKSKARAAHLRRKSEKRQEEENRAEVNQGGAENGNSSNGSLPERVQGNGHTNGHENGDSSGDSSQQPNKSIGQPLFRRILNRLHGRSGRREDIV